MRNAEFPLFNDQSSFRIVFRALADARASAFVYKTSLQYRKTIV
jgi:hypothetical protein